jgi:hypothetical protein
MMLKTKNFGPWERTAGLTSGRVRFADGTKSRTGTERAAEDPKSSWAEQMPPIRGTKFSPTGESA